MTDPSPIRQRITAPVPPQAPPPYRFPVVASVAPLMVAAVLWGVTGSAFALLFAVFGPVTAVASFVDSRLGARRTARGEEARFGAESTRVAAEIAAAHAAERGALAESAPAVSDLLGRSGADPWRWTTDPGGPVPLRLGTGEVGSELVVHGAPPPLAALAATLTDAPVVVDARLGIGVCGPSALAHAVARALTLQLAWALSPARCWLAASAPWAEALPHPRRAAPARAGVIAEFGVDGAAIAVVAVAPTRRELPGECRVVLELGAGGARIVEHPDRSRRVAVRVAPLSSRTAAAWAARTATDARREGLVVPESTVPATVPLSAFLPPAQEARSSSGEGLPAVFAVDGAGAVPVDLVADGPHAVVGGTTGSGKSELLVSWVLAMAAAHPPERVTFLLVDFKGGAAFSALAGLVHTVGVVTDLDAVEVARALASLRAELRYRERVIAESGAREISGTVDLPRLVIVVDEFAAMLAEHPDLHALFADIAARGRSLGVHLVLCTQRPAGVVRDALLANADLRVSLRVNNAADSTAVVGSDAAARLPPAARGAGFFSRGGEPARRVQFALADDSTAAEVAARWATSPAPRRPWCPPLPPVVRELESVLEGVPFALLDLPQEQRRGIAVWRPVVDGHLLVVGAARSGKSTAIAALRPAMVLPASVPAAWDMLAEVEAARDAVVAVDDVDALLSRFPSDYRDVVVERLARVLREGPARGVHLVLGAQRVTADVQALASLAPARLWLRHSSRQDLVLAGGDGAHWDPALPPGGGWWRGERAQVVLVDVPARSEQPLVADAPGGPLAIVTSRPALLLDRIRTAGRGVARLNDVDPPQPGRDDSVVVGDVDDWQSRWGALAAMRSRATVLVEGCTTADFRALTRSRELPPPLVGLRGVAWQLLDDGEVIRVRLPF